MGCVGDEWGCGGVDKTIGVEDDGGGEVGCWELEGCGTEGGRVFSLRVVRMVGSCTMEVRG